MPTRMPGYLMAVLSEALAATHTHASLDNLFLYAGAPGDPPEGSKPVKALEWLRRVNDDPKVEPLTVLGRLLEPVLDREPSPWDSDHIQEQTKRLQEVLARAGFQYRGGGRVTAGLGVPTRTLSDLIRARDLLSIHEEFDRALENVTVNPREAVSAASNTLEAICKTYIEDEGLEMPAKQDLPSVWSAVRKHLGFDPAAVQDDDLKMILSGLISTVTGIGNLRTHASTAHAPGRKRYRLDPRHARLAVHSAHTVAAFILESWDAKAAQGVRPVG